MTAVNPGDQKSRLHEALARHAYRIFESRGSSPGHQAEDWKSAEADVVHPLACGLITRDDKVSVSTDLAAFDTGSVEVCVEPRRLTLCGKPTPGFGGCACVPPESVYRILDLPVEVDPSRVGVRLNGRILQVDLCRPPLAAHAA